MNTIKVSVIIPCRNEQLYIEECVHAIYASQLPEDVRISVFVVDGMSDDGTREKIHALQSVYESLKLIDNTRQLTPYAFNLGIYADMTADYIQIVGARHILSTNYLIECLNQLQTDPATWCVGGKIVNQYINKTGEHIAKAMSTSFGMGLGNFRTLNESGYTDTVTSPMYPMWVFEKIGYFDEELVRNQDDDFNYRVSKSGGKIFFHAGISLKYYVRGNLRQLWKQFMQYGYWKVYVNKKHKAVTTLRQLVPPLFVLFLILLPFSFLIHPLIGLIGFGFLGLYVLLDMLVTTKIADGVSEFNKIMLIFPILHISYGWGYLKGIAAFLIANKKPGDKYKKMSR